MWSKARNSGTSRDKVAMTPEQFERFQQSLKETVSDQIKLTVNGKIDGLRKDLQNYVDSDAIWKEVDKTWKEDAQPSIDLGKNVKWGGMFIASVIAVGGGLIVIVEGIIKFIMWISHK